MNGGTSPLTLTLSPGRGDSFGVALKIRLTSVRIQRGVFQRRGERFSLSPGGGPG